MKIIELETFEISPIRCYDIDGIQRIPASNLSYNKFFNEFMTKNLPVIIENIKITTETSSCWFENGKFDIDALGRMLGDHEVPISNCSTQYYDSHEKTTMRFDEFVNFWKSDRTQQPTRLFYLKDFHLKQEFPDIDFYHVPEYFTSDWLNEFLIDHGKGDYRFIYIGPKDTW